MKTAMLTLALTLTLPAFALTTGAAPTSLATPTIETTVSANTDETVLYKGSVWVKKTNKVAGAYEIIERDGERFLRVGKDFKTKKGPDLKFVLSPLLTKHAKNKNALKGGLIVALLTSHKGAQEHAIPEGADLSKYKSLLIHCEKYTKLWGASQMEKVD